ncbi:hypothetical protein ACVR05_10235 [Streptococcus caprae]|uniref:DUF3042 family protein n=1 Tax=Streptococcus caprae TaxID=1640501 RepID=A0ABV8CTE6_9STRE
MAKSTQRTSKLMRLVQFVTVVLPAIQVVRGMIKDYKAEKNEKR